MLYPLDSMDTASGRDWAFVVKGWLSLSLLLWGFYSQMFITTTGLWCLIIDLTIFDEYFVTIKFHMRTQGWSVHQTGRLVDLH